MYSSMYLDKGLQIKSKMYNSKPTGLSTIPQLDGNMSLSSLSSSLTSLDASSSISILDVTHCSAVNSIPVFLGNRPPTNNQNAYLRKPSCIKTLRRSNKTLQSISLPLISVYNMRSLLPKLDSFTQDFEDRATGLSILTEIWEKADNKKHQKKLQELFEMKGILYISTPRSGLKRGGGVAIVADPTRFLLSKFSVSNALL